MPNLRRALLPAALLFAIEPARPERADLSINVTLTGPHAGSYSGASPLSCVGTEEGLVAGYMPAVVEQGLRSFRLVVEEQSPAGSDDFTLTFALARMNRVYATFSLDPQNGAGSGTARTVRRSGQATLEVSGTSSDGTRITVRVQCSVEGPEPLIADATAEDEERSDEEPETSAVTAAEDVPPLAYIDDRAATFAGRIAMRGEGSREALHEAIQWAGFGVRDASGTLIRSQYSWAQGVYFDPIDLDLMERSIRVDQRTPLGVIAAGFAKSVPGTTEAALAELLVTDLRRHAASTDPALRFWARFIGALSDDEAGRFAGRADTLGLTPIQATFLLQRLQADFLIAQRQASEGRTGSLERLSPHELRRNASVEQPSLPGLRMSGPSAPPEVTPLRATDQCKLGDTETTVLDWNAVGMTTAFGEFAKRVVPPVEKYASAAGHASFAFSMMKMIGMISMLEVKTEMEGDRPLERTKSTEDHGEKRRLITKLRLPASGNAKVLNCMRPIFNAAGLDLSIADGGPVKDAEVEYQMIEDGSGRVVGTTRTSEQMPVIEWAKGENPIKGNISNDQGEADIWLTGTPQRGPVSTTARQVEKRGAVRVNVALTRNSLFKDLPGLTGGFISALTNPVMAAIGMIPEMIMRIPLPKETMTFKIRDWGDEVTFAVSVFEVQMGEAPCPENMSLGIDNIEGMIALKRDTVASGSRTTVAPACGGKPIKSKCPRGERCNGGERWDGDPEGCALMLNGSQRLRVTRRIYVHPEHGRVLRINWSLRSPGASQASVSGDCLTSRWGHEIPPDNEFMVTTKEEVRDEYNGYDLGRSQRTRKWVGTGSSVTIPFPHDVKFPYRANALTDQGPTDKVIVELW